MTFLLNTLPTFFVDFLNFICTTQLFFVFVWLFVFFGLFQLVILIGRVFDDTY